MPHPIAFSDAQITAVLDAAKVLAPDVRAAFLEAVVEALQGSDVGEAGSRTEVYAVGEPAPRGESRRIEDDGHAAEAILQYLGEKKLV